MNILTVQYVCVACNHLFRIIPEDKITEKNNIEETCTRCGVHDVPWLIWQLRNLNQLNKSP